MKDEVILRPGAPGEPDRPALADDESPLDDLGHPTGTLAIVAIYGLLFVVGWLALYFLEFLPRGAPH
ncbi:MAG: hypothetical protein MPN21_04265 [Thermoanaerobaculia bacterium]|nr:hypothetical protein [Thermoanaerobaculia bacterium]